MENDLVHKLMNEKISLGVSPRGTGEKYSTEDFGSPKELTGRGSRVEKLPEPSRIVNMDDLEYFLKKKWISLPVPAWYSIDSELLLPAEYLSKKFMLKYLGIAEEPTAEQCYDRAMKVVDAY